ncbi:MAG TPA: hypothetical protein VK062_03045 [Burkholderiaceae bacterium]|nr:hypothetical protein [Burkholderiaceae bacterium]
MNRREALLQTLGPLPIRGTAWPGWVKVLAWCVLAIIGIKLIHTATSTAGQDIRPVIAASVTITFMALIVVARNMQTSVTTITTEGIEQTWLTRRTVRWDDIQFAKFIPMVASKRLVCFTGRGRPVIFQGGTRELQIAFAHIALAYRRQPG